MNIITFDIEEWFHIKFDTEFLEDNQISKYENRLENNMEFIFRLLQKHDLKATFFCLGWVARNYPKIIKEIDRQGHEIGSHSDKHKLVYDLNQKQFSEDLKISLESIEDLIGKKVKIFRAPSFSICENNSWAFDELINQGIQIDCSIFPAKRKNGGFESFVTDLPSIVKTEEKREIKEFPINTYNILNTNIIFSGGGYFRILPYSILRKLMIKSNYVMTYFHPRDFDPDQPILDNISPIRYFKSYVGLSNSKNKIEKLLNDYEFINVSEASNRIDWSKVPIHELH